jgi:NAD-dependent deacetylase
MKKKKNLVVFSGAGMSADSGLKTFRDHDGLWETHKITDVATMEAWRKHPKVVLEFYNMRRSQLLKAKPNKAHKLVVDFEKEYDVTVITQNIDNLHEKAGSTKVLHLHGELLKVKSEVNDDLIYDWKHDLNLNDKGEDGHQLRPHVVWFGEEVPKIWDAEKIIQKADIFITIGTSLNVYPAAGLIQAVSNECECFLIDPNIPQRNYPDNWHLINQKAEEGLEEVKKVLVNH